jgi:hypothetical protein
MAHDGGALEDLIRDILNGKREEEVAPYLTQRTIHKYIALLWGARRGRGLLQSDIADRSGLSLAAVKRIDCDISGTTRLKEFFAYLVACDLVPTVPATSSIEEARLAALRELDRPPHRG